jgi:hypothetical protein
MNLPHIAFQLECALLRRVLRENPPASRRAYCEPPGIRNIAQVAQGIVRGGGDEQFPVEYEELIEPFPPVADHGHAARARFKQPYARRVAGLLHGGTGDIQREPL